MYRILLAFVFFLLAGIGLALVFHDNPGHLQVAYGDWRLETSLLFTVAGLVLAACVLLLLWRLVVLIVCLPVNMFRIGSRRQQRKAENALQQGLMHLFEGAWDKAERVFLRFADRGRNAGVDYLGAAYAAQRQHVVARRDRYLAQARGQEGASELAVLFTQANLQAREGQNEAAVATLSRLRSTNPNHGPALTLLARMYARLGDWAQVRNLLPGLRKNKGVSDKEWRALAVPAWADKLATRADGSANPSATWDQMPGDLCNEQSVQKIYVEQLCALGDDKTAAAFIHAALKQDWAPDLVLAYGHLKLKKPSQQLGRVEGWIQKYGERPELQLVAGQLCLQNRLWGRARSYLEACLGGELDAQARLELGRLHEQIEQPPEALEAYREGLETSLKAQA